jgi:hypothetical protein
MTKTMVAVAGLVVALGVGAIGCTQSVDGTGTSNHTGTDTGKAKETQSGAAESSNAANAHCASGTYAANVNGEQALAKVSYEVLVERTAVAGEISSSSAYYTFTGDLYGDRGWVDVVTHGSNERFRAQIDVIPNGFIFTANAFEGAGSTAYEFKCQ